MNKTDEFFVMFIGWVIFVMCLLGTIPIVQFLYFIGTHMKSGVCQ